MTDPTFTLLAAPVVDLDGTFFVQGGLFLLLCIVLNVVLFQPWLKLRDLRVDRIDGALARSVEVLAEAEALGTSYRASAGGGATVVLTVNNGLVEATWTGEGFQQRFLPSESRFDVSGTLPVATAGLTRQARRERTKLLNSISRGLSDRIPGRGHPDGGTTFTLEGVAEDQVGEARRRFLEAGAPEVTVAPAGPG